MASESAIAAFSRTATATSRVLREVSEDFMLQLVKETDQGEEVLSVEGISEDTSPIIKLLNTTILDAINRRASDIHIETRPGGCGHQVPHRRRALSKPANRWTSSSRRRSSRVIKVMSELDIAERRVPQDGRFKIRLGSKSIDFRVSIMPSVLRRGCGNPNPGQGVASPAT
ncbi:MAG: Flp pilus assembly complex ATPase component TadA [Desulfobacterales bacterium]|nr:Flp pilus assembly complex ATPase component TadA [Desulfobacterales bacterium]